MGEGKGDGCCKTGTSINLWAEMACCGGSNSTGGMGSGDGVGTRSNLFTYEQTQGSRMGCEL